MWTSVNDKYKVNDKVINHDAHSRSNTFIYQECSLEHFAEESDVLDKTEKLESVFEF